MRQSARSCCLVMLTLLVACRGDTPAAPPDEAGGIRLAVVSGNGQSGPAGTELPNALVASLVDQRGHPVWGDIVNFRVVSGGGSVFAGSSISDKDGLVKDYWTLGMSGPQVLEVRAVDPTTGEKRVYATFTATISTPPPPPPPLDADSDGFTVAQGDCNDNDAAIKPGAPDDPDGAYVDNNCDGIDGTKTSAVFVATGGFDVPTCGDFATPCASIVFGLSRAGALARTKMFIGAGNYVGAVTLANGVSMYGGYSVDFSSRSSGNNAVVSGAAEYGQGGIRYTVLGENLTLPVAIVQVNVQAPNAVGQQIDGSGKHAVGLLLRNVPLNVVTIASSSITVGNGSVGLPGAAGTPASNVSAPRGGNGGSAETTNGLCDDNTQRLGGAGSGTGALGGGAGGRGGKADTNCDVFSFNFNATVGLGGGLANLTGALFGNGGSGGGVCGTGQPGQPGRARIDGSNGGGGGNHGTFGGFLIIDVGNGGGLGADGTGGGGGGGSGGCDSGLDAYGAGGGGGGAGGVRAPTAGTGGKGGGASIGIYLISANVATSNVSISRGAGGNGGAGGAGARGQPGSLGGDGGFRAGDGGNGGAGGAGSDGGYAGAGGGGSGGPSIGILGTGGSAFTNVGLIVFGSNGGSGGNGGARGDGTLAAAGASGSSANTLVIP